MILSFYSKYYVTVGSEYYTFSTKLEHIFPKIVFDYSDDSKKCRSDALDEDQKEICIKHYDIVSGLPTGPSRLTPLCTEKPENVDDSLQNYNVYSPLAAYQIHIYELLLKGIVTKEGFTPHLPDINITLELVEDKDTRPTITLDKLDTDGISLSTYKLIEALDKVQPSDRATYTKNILEQNFYLIRDSKTYALGCMSDSHLFKEKKKVQDHITFVRNFFEVSDFKRIATPGTFPFIVTVLLLVVFPLRFWWFPETDTVFTRHEVPFLWNWLIVPFEAGIFVFFGALTVFAFYNFEIKTEILDNFDVECIDIYYNGLQGTSMALFVLGLITVLTYLGDQLIRMRKDGVPNLVKAGSVYVGIAQMPV